VPNHPNRPRPGERPLPKNPRRVRGGIRLTRGVVDGPALWAAQRWLRVIGQGAPGQSMLDGLAYARDGQTRRLEILAGRIEADVQGRASHPYLTRLELATIPPTGWERVIGAMSQEAAYAARLLAGELPANIEDAFGPLDLHLFPANAGEICVSCTCTERRQAEVGRQPDSRWCKHACCVAYLVAQRLANEPYLIFLLRGMEGQDLLARLCERRAAVTMPPGERVPVYVQHVPGLVDYSAPPLEVTLSHFWEAGPGLAEVDIPLQKPEVSHALLRRLGPSPLGGSFPIVGFLASCYDVISEAALNPKPTGEPPRDLPDRTD
jgi:uncharacterized Zn finger protein